MKSLATVVLLAITVAGCNLTDLLHVTQTVTVTLRPTNPPGPNGQTPECAGLVVGAAGVAGGIEVSLPENGPAEVAAFVDGGFRGTFGAGDVIPAEAGTHDVAFSTLDGACDSDPSSVEVPS